MARKNRRADNSRQRQAVASEAARLMQNHGLRDYRIAKSKASDRLGLGRQGALPSNGEVELALVEHQRIFAGDEHESLQAQLRAAAADMMRMLHSFSPRLVGDVLAGTANEHSLVDLHLFSDTPELVSETLAMQGIRHRSTARRHRLRPGPPASYAAFACRLSNCEYMLTIFPLSQRGQPPLSPVDGRPMRRAKLRVVEGLLEGCGSE